MYEPTQDDVEVFDKLTMGAYLKRHMDWSRHSFGPWEDYKWEKGMRGKPDYDDWRTTVSGNSFKVPMVKYKGPVGTVDHIRRELVEIEQDGYFTPTEWIDVVILGIDGYIRSGGKPEEFLIQLFGKQRKNFNRVWPDWKTADRSKAIEHKRGIHD